MAQGVILRTIQATAPELIERCTSVELARIIAALDSHWHQAAAWKEREILADGYVWDGSALRNIEAAA